MPGTVFVHLGVSLDGFIAGPDRGPHNPLGGRAHELHDWMFATRTFRTLHGAMGEGGERGPDDDRVKAIVDRIGAVVIGKRMFEEGEANWPENAPFHCPVFVLTHEKRAPWERPGGTTFHFVNDGIESALAQARRAAGGKDVRIGGGASTVRQYLDAGLVDELELVLAPVLLREGLRLFDGLERDLRLELVESAPGAQVTHLRYAIRR